MYLVVIRVFEVLLRFYLLGSACVGGFLLGAYMYESTIKNYHIPINYDGVFRLITYRWIKIIAKLLIKTINRIFDLLDNTEDLFFWIIAIILNGTILSVCYYSVYILSSTESVFLTGLISIFSLVYTYFFLVILRQFYLEIKK